MAQRTLYAYVHGSNHAEIASKVEARLDALVAARKWISKDVWVVNQQEPPSCNFVIGIHDAKSGTTTDLFVVDSAQPDLEKLREALLRK